MKPFELTFGTQDANYMKIPEADLTIQTNE
jgi:hypothetical protein